MIGDKTLKGTMLKGNLLRTKKSRNQSEHIARSEIKSGKAMRCIVFCMMQIVCRIHMSTPSSAY